MLQFCWNGNYFFLGHNVYLSCGNMLRFNLTYASSYKTGLLGLENERSLSKHLEWPQVGFSRVFKQGKAPLLDLVCKLLL